MRMHLVLAFLAIGCSEGKNDLAGETPTPSPSGSPKDGSHPKAGPITQEEAVAPTTSEASLLIRPEAYYLASTDGRTQKIALCGTDFDREALAVVLCQLRESGVLSSIAPLEIAAEGSVTYQSIISTMDRAITMGISQFDFIPAGNLASKPRRKGAGVENVEPLCGDYASPCSAGVRSGLELPSETMRAEQKKAPVIVATASEIRLNESVVISLQDLPQQAGKVIPKLEKALRRQQRRFTTDPTIAVAEREELRRTVILQGDKDTTAKVLNQILATTTKVDYTNVLFAVNMKN